MKLTKLKSGNYGMIGDVAIEWSPEDPSGCDIIGDLITIVLEIPTNLE